MIILTGRLGGMIGKRGSCRVSENLRLLNEQREQILQEAREQAEEILRNANANAAAEAVNQEIAKMIGETNQKVDAIFKQVYEAAVQKKIELSRITEDLEVQVQRKAKEIENQTYFLSTTDQGETND